MTRSKAGDTEGAKGTITFLITSLYRGGAETQVVRVAIGMKQRGWLTRIVTVMDHNDFETALASAGIPVESLSIPRGRYDPRSLTRLVRILRNHHPDVICTFMYHANVLGRIAARLVGIPIVVSSIRNLLFGGRLSERLMSATDRLANVTTTNSVQVAQQLVQKGIVDPRRMLVIPNAIQTSALSVPQPTRAELVGPGLEDRWLWLSVGRLEPQKAHHVLLKALALLRSDGRDVHLALVGAGSLERDLLALSERLGLSGNVTFLGYRNDVRDLMAVADGFVLASGWEGLPNAVIEACLARLPVVATDVGGVSEIVEDATSGIVVTPNDPMSLFRGMRTLITLPREDRETMVEKAYEDVSLKFASTHVMARWDALFSSLVGAGLPGRPDARN
ncbi:MAG: glycosyltransferase [Trueperaceae bacterium]